MIKNVKCKTCGFQGYNPNVPIGHAIDTCSSTNCYDVHVFGFINGDTSDLKIHNLYGVHKNVGYQTVNMDTLSSKQIYDNNLIALMHHYYGLRDYDLLNKTLKSSSHLDNGEFHYYTAKVFFKRDNASKGVKHLKISASKGFNPAKTEYGYIIATGLYSVLIDLNEGINHLIEAAEQGEVFAGAYLADIFYRSVYIQSHYDDILPEDWFKYIELGTKINDEMAHIVLGTFYLNGFGTTVNLHKAIDHLKVSADEGYVIAMEFLVQLYYDHMFFEGYEIVNEILHYGKLYLDTATDSSTNSYKRIKEIYGIATTI